MQTASQRRALGRYSHVRMVPPPLWLPKRRAPRSPSGRAKVSGLAYERTTIAEIRLAFANCTDFYCISQLINATQPLRCIDSNIVQSNRIENKQTWIGRPELIASQWIEYQKNQIRHLCQPDLLIIFPSTNHPVGPIPSGNHLTTSRKVPSGNLLNKIGGGTPNPSLIICCEIKLTYTPIAIKKLNRLYLPLVDSIFHPHILIPLIICKNLTNLSPPHSFSLSNSLLSSIPLVTYPGSGNFHIV